jgi:hypothetical protein
MGFKDSLTGVMVLLFGGLGFLIYYFVIRNKTSNGRTTTTTQTSPAAVDNQN